MKHLVQIESGIDTRPIRYALACNDDLWHLPASRQRATISVQEQTQTIFLRRAVPAPSLILTENIHQSALDPLAWRLPETVLLCQALAQDLGVELGRAMLVRLPAGRNVGAHRDEGAYYAIRDRYHLVVANEPHGSILQVADEEADLPPDTLWRIDNKRLHAARNRSGADRIHLIFDVLPRIGERTTSNGSACITNAKAHADGSSPSTKTTATGTIPTPA